jgi:hypothetical protein
MCVMVGNTYATFVLSTICAPSSFSLGPPGFVQLNLLLNLFYIKIHSTAGISLAVNFQNTHTHKHNKQSILGPFGFFFCCFKGKKDAPNDIYLFLI